MGVDMKYSGVRPKELAALYRAVERSGVGVSQTGSGHVRMAFPDGSVAFGPLTSGDPNAHKIVARGLRARHGWTG